MSLLETRSLSITFGGVHALRNVSISVEQGKLVGLIGPNGAGKTTLIRSLTGALRPDQGTVLLDGKALNRMPTHARVKAGLAMTHQIVRPFRNLTMAENVAIAAARDITAAPLAALTSVDRERHMARAYDLLSTLGIGDAADRLAGTVPLGYLKRLEMARALATEPRIILLDEPLAGLNQAEAAKIADEIVHFCEAGVTILLVEHNLSEVVRVSNRLIVLDNGSVIAEGEPREVIRREQVRAAYFGEKRAEASNA